MSTIFKEDTKRLVFPIPGDEFSFKKGINEYDEKRRPHNGRCNGDCANCPPHYGYRYGRWYYGHGHIYGCEFGGNKGDGGM